MLDDVVAIDQDVSKVTSVVGTVNGPLDGTQILSDTLIMSADGSQSKRGAVLVERVIFQIQRNLVKRHSGRNIADGLYFDDLTDDRRIRQGNHGATISRQSNTVLRGIYKLCALEYLQGSEHRLLIYGYIQDQWCAVKHESENLAAAIFLCCCLPTNEIRKQGAIDVLSGCACTYIFCSADIVLHIQESIIVKIVVKYYIAHIVNVEILESKAQHLIGLAMVPDKTDALASNPLPIEPDNKLLIAAPDDK